MFGVWIKFYLMLLLLVDDDAEDRDVFCEALSLIDHSINCVSAKNGVECLLLLQSMGNRPDFIFLDLNMPLMDGVSCLKEIRRRKCFDDVRVVMCSTTIGAQEKSRCAALGANAFLIKPATFDEMNAALRSLFLSLPAGETVTL
jgi:CheY-like chemotaxis protein